MYEGAKKKQSQASDNLLLESPLVRRGFPYMCTVSDKNFSSDRESWLSRAWSATRYEQMGAWSATLVKHTCIVVLTDSLHIMHIRLTSFI